MASDVMSVRLWLPRIRVLEVVPDAPERLVVRVASTVRCPGCGTPSGRCHDRREREIRDLEVSGRPVRFGVVPAAHGLRGVRAGGSWKPIGRSRAASRRGWLAGWSTTPARCRSTRWLAVMG